MWGGATSGRERKQVAAGTGRQENATSMGTSAVTRAGRRCGFDCEPDRVTTSVGFQRRRRHPACSPKRFMMTDRETQACGRERDASREADPIRSRSCRTAAPIVVIADMFAHVSPAAFHCIESRAPLVRDCAWPRKNGPLGTPGSF